MGGEKNLDLAALDLGEGADVEHWSLASGGFELQRAARWPLDPVLAGVAQDEPGDREEDGVCRFNGKPLEQKDGEPEGGDSKYVPRQYVQLSEVERLIN